MKTQTRTEVTAIFCLKTRTWMYSRSRHDFRMCPCGCGIGIDGGFDYLRVLFRDNPPKTKKFIINVSAQELYQDWNTGTDKYGLILEDFKVIGNQRLDKFGLIRESKKGKKILKKKD